MKPAIFLDRDGVIIEEVNYLADIGQVRLTAGSAEAIRGLNRLGISVVVVTNQAGVARGMFSEERVRVVHEHLQELLAGCGAHIDRFYYCPHHETEGVGPYRVACACRKPRPGMLERAASELDLDLARSWLVGDKVSDLEAGARVGCRTILVRTGHGTRVTPEELKRTDLGLVAVASDLAEAVETILRARDFPQMPIGSQ